MSETYFIKVTTTAGPLTFYGTHGDMLRMLLELRAAVNDASRPAPTIAAVLVKSHDAYFDIVPRYIVWLEHNLGAD